MSSVPQPQHNSQMDEATMLGALVEAACQRSNLPTTTDVATHDDSIVTEDNLESECYNLPTTTMDVATHDNSIITEDNLESAQQQCSHSTSSSTPTAKAAETLLSCNRRIHNVESGQSERCGKTPV
eukprot:scaffold20403_cov53-Attheya_sp.AAC.3